MNSFNILDYTSEIILLAWVGYGILCLYKKYVMVDKEADSKINIMSRYCKLEQMRNEE